MNIDLVYADLNIAYLKKGWFDKKEKIEVDLSGNKNYLLTGPFYPKNSSWGLNAWVNNFFSWVEHYIDKEGVPDVIHAHTYLGAAVAVKVKKQYNIPVIVSEHYTGWMDDSIRPLHKKIGLKALMESDVVTTVSSALRASMADYLKREIKVLPNFVDTGLFNYNNSQKAEAASNKIICVGDLIPRKRIDLSLKIIKQLSKHHDVHFTIVGGGNERKNLQNLAKEINLENKTTFTGKLEKRAITKLLNQHNILLHSSQLETFGLVVAEALCCGLCVVSAPNQGVEMMKKLPGLFISRDDSSKSLLVELENAMMNSSGEDFNAFRKKISDKSRKALSVKTYLLSYLELVSCD